MVNSNIAQGALPYPFKCRPYNHQLECWYAQRDKNTYAIFAEQGTGKTKITIDTAAWLYDADRIDALVVIAPKGVYRNWGDAELPAHMPAHIRYRVGVWTAESKRADEDALARLNRRDGNMDLHVLLMNVEALGRDLQHNRAFECLQDFLTSHNALLAVDESTTIKNPIATRTKALMKARLLAPYRRILTGQPAVNGPLDLYSQCAFLDPEALGYSSYYSYRAHFAKLVPMRVGNRKFHKVTGYQNLEELNRILQRFAFIVKKEDCLDLPPKVYMPPRYVDLGKQQASAYRDMQSMATVAIEEVLQKPLEGDAGVSTAGLVITQMLRLQQILCGFMVSDDRQVIPFEEVNPRMEALMEALDESAGKAIIWATYRYNVRQIAARIAEQYGPEAVVTYYGETSMEDRRAALSRFQNPSDPCRFFVANKTGARGITLTQAGHVFYFANDYDLDTRCQNEDRAHRIGQSKSVTYTDFIARGTQDEKVVEALRRKLDISKVITASNWKEFVGLEPYVSR